MRLSLQKEDKARAFDVRCQAARCRDIVEMFGQDPLADSPLVADWITTPIGLMVAIADRHALHILEFIERPALATEIRTLRAATGCVINEGQSDVINHVKAALAAYFAGTGLQPDLRLSTVGTPFQKQVWRALQTIPPGRTESYSGLAQQLGRPDAARAVARANGANPFALVVPCHRLLGSDGALTGYGGGIWRKDWLLRHEKRMASKDVDMTLRPSAPRDLLEDRLQADGRAGSSHA